MPVKQFSNLTRQRAELINRIRAVGNIHIVGISGSEGAAIALFLADLKVHFTGHDFTTKSKFKKTIAASHFGIPAGKRDKITEKLWQLRNQVHFQDQYLAGIGKADLIFVSQNFTGYSANKKLCKIYRQSPAKFLTLTQLYFQLFPGKIMAITGTNGKSTTSRLIADIMQASRLTSYFTGNDRRNVQILDRHAKWTKQDWLVVEVSNRQLNFPLGRSPDIGVITNVTDNHLDEYGNSFAKYKSCKLSLIKQQNKQQIAILNQNNPATRSFAKRIKSQIQFFSIKNQIDRGVYLDDDSIVYSNKTKMNVTSTCQIKILGQHNLENVMAAIAATRSAGVDWTTIRKVVKKFRGISGRLEKIAIKRGVTFVDDSSSTSPDSGIAAIQSFGRESVHLIAGGDPKGINYAKFAASCKQQKLLSTTLIDSPAGRAMAKEFKKRGIPYSFRPAFRQAVQHAAASAKRGEVVLFSPTAAWFIYHIVNKIPGGGKGFAEIVAKL